MKEDFEELLNYCLYICDDTEILLDLSVIQIKYFSDMYTEDDYNELIGIDRKLREQFR